MFETSQLGTVTSIPGTRKSEFKSKTQLNVIQPVFISKLTSFIVPPLHQNTPHSNNLLRKDILQNWVHRRDTTKQAPYIGQKKLRFSKRKRTTMPDAGEDAGAP